MRTKSAFQGMLAWMAIMLNLSACNGQTSSDKNAPISDTNAVIADTPQVDVRVNKQYDEQGNLIAYDSSYTSVLSGHSGDASYLDSLFKGFMSGFGTHYPFLNDPGFQGLFFPDTSFYQDFFHNDFFQRRMEMNQRYMQRMMEQMDSLKNQHFLEPSSPVPPVKGTSASCNKLRSGILTHIPLRNVQQCFDQQRDQERSYET